MDEILQKLEEFGINEKAAKIYINLLRNQDVPVYKVATASKIPRTTVYAILEELESQGLVSSWKKNNVKYYSAENPENLKRILKNKELALNEIFGDLNSMFKLERDNPKTRVLIGVEGVKIAFEHMLDVMLQEKLKLVYAFFESQLTELFPKFFFDWRERKNKKTGATTFLLVPSGMGLHEHYKSDPFRVTREMPKTWPGGSFAIIGSNVFFFSFKENEVYSIIIESKIVSTMFGGLFMYIWNTLEIDSVAQNKVEI
jgi:sugar-specific transcriptional regulator TrmB